MHGIEICSNSLNLLTEIVKIIMIIKVIELEVIIEGKLKEKTFRIHTFYLETYRVSCVWIC